MPGTSPTVRRWFASLLACMMVARVIVLCDVASAQPMVTAHATATATHGCGDREVPLGKAAGLDHGCIAGCALLPGITPASIVADVSPAARQDFISTTFFRIGIRPDHPPPRHVLVVRT